MEALDGTAASCPKLHRLQEKRIDLARKNRTLTASQASRKREFERDLSASMRSLHLTDARIEALVDELRNGSERLRRREFVVKHATLTPQNYAISIGYSAYRRPTTAPNNILTIRR